jgi:hypothetical protein
MIRGIRVNVPVTEKCSWCGESVERDDGYRALEVSGNRSAVFCRLEHVVPWFIQGPHWHAGVPQEPDGWAVSDCSHCGAPLADTYVVLVRHRGEHRVPDAFCSAEHLAEWAKSGGRWGQP